MPVANMFVRMLAHAHMNIQNTQFNGTHLFGMLQVEKRRQKLKAEIMAAVKVHI